MKNFCNHLLVMGSAGPYFGPHLCKRLVTDGNNLLYVDNFYTETKDNIFHLMDNPYFELRRHDIAFPLHVEVDEIYNLACSASPSTASLISDPDNQDLYPQYKQYA